MLDKIELPNLNLDTPILVTGAGGCIGSWVLSILMKNNIPTIAFDLTENKKRLSYLIDDKIIAKIPWVQGDVSDINKINQTIHEYGVKSIIHLAALQVPFCAEDPIRGAKVNVVGTVNIFESAKKNNINKVTYASSVAAHGFLPYKDAMKTLYGAYKLCNENIAQVYWNQHKIPSVCLRPGIVTGVCRDQGMTSKTTVALLAAVLNERYTIPFSGLVSNVHAAEVACAFIHSISFNSNGSFSFDINGPSIKVEEIVNITKEILPNSNISISGKQLNFPGDLSDTPLRKFIRDKTHDYIKISAKEAIIDTIESFKILTKSGKINKTNLN